MLVISETSITAKALQCFQKMEKGIKFLGLIQIYQLIFGN